jgi:hypothetical protein
MGVGVVVFFALWLLNLRFSSVKLEEVGMSGPRNLAVIVVYQQSLHSRFCCVVVLWSSSYFCFREAKW